MQNIPSHDKTVRMIFRPTDGYAIIGGDYSGQEPRSLCAFAQDKNMQQAYEQKKDLYAVIGSACFKNDYTDNLEFKPMPDGTVIQSQEGKERRSKSKTVMLGTLYGMSAATLGKRMNLTLEEAQQIVDSFYEGFPGIDKFTQDSQKMAKEKGYVTNMFGYRRHLPDATLPPFTVEPIKKNDTFNPLVGAIEHKDKLLESKISSYEKQLKKATKKFERNSIIKNAEKDGLKVRNNGAFISRALRQTLNARIQGTAASMTKLAMIMIRNDPELINLDAHLLATIHDEVFLEAPIANKDRVAKRLCELMVTAANVKCSFTPWSVDPYIIRDGWYEDENISKIHETYEKFIKKGSTETEAINKTREQFSMYNPDSIKLVCEQKYEIFKDSLINGPAYFEGK